VTPTISTTPVPSVTPTISITPSITPTRSTSSSPSPTPPFSPATFGELVIWIDASRSSLPYGTSITSVTNFGTGSVVQKASTTAPGAAWTAPNLFTIGPTLNSMSTYTLYQGILQSTVTFSGQSRAAFIVAEGIEDFATVTAPWNFHIAGSVNMVLAEGCCIGVQASGSFPSPPTFGVAGMVNSVNAASNRWSFNNAQWPLITTNQASGYSTGSVSQFMWSSGNLTIAEFLLFDADISPSSASAIETYLMTKWGI